MVANQTMEPTTAETRAEWLNYYEFYNRGSTREGKRVRVLIEQVERLTGERDALQVVVDEEGERGGAALAERNEAQAEVKALTKQLEKATGLLNGAPNRPHTAFDTAWRKRVATFMEARDGS